MKQTRKDGPPKDVFEFKERPPADFSAESFEQAWFGYTKSEMTDYSQLDVMKAKLDALRPIDPEKWQPVAEKFRVEWTYHSNAIEGNPLTLSETSFFIREGLTSKGKPLAAFLEIKNHIAAVDFLEEIVRNKETITEGLIKQYHAMLFKNIEFVELKSGGATQRVKVEAGVYKKEKNHVVRLDGNIHFFTEPLQVPGEMHRLIGEYATNREKLHPVELAARLHHGLVAIHPFIDGNGRVARLLMNTILMQAGYTPAIISVEEKRQYLEALESADNGQYSALFTFIEQTLGRSLRTTIDVIEGRDAFNFEDLARMFRNAAEQASAIQQELGPATIPPEARSVQTARQIAEAVQTLLKEFAQKASTPHINQTVGTQPQLTSTNRFKTLISRIVGGNTVPAAVLQIAEGGKRYVPSLAATFYLISGRFQIALASSTNLAVFNENLQENWNFEVASSELVGSIYFEDWDSQVISDFVLNALKAAINHWTAEMDRRKGMIAKQELEAEKFRAQKG